MSASELAGAAGLSRRWRFGRIGRAVFVCLAVTTMLGCVGARAGVGPGVCSAEAGLNHFYVVLDEETFRAAATSEFLSSEWAAVDAGLPAFAEPDSTSQRIFIRGRNTYLELFRHDNRFGEPVGKVGIALGVDRAGELECVQQNWTARLDGTAERSRIDRQTDGGPVPWYDALYRTATSANDHLVIWAVEYAPGFAQWLHGAHAGGPGAVARSDVLGPRFDADRLLDDVIGLTVSAPGEIAGAIADQLGATGYTRVSPGGVAELTGGGWSLRLVDGAEEPAGLLAVRFSTTREREGVEVVPIGPRSVLVFLPGRQAAWYFL